MLEEIALALVAIVISGAVFFYLARRDERALATAAERMHAARDQLKIAERKFMQGRMKKSVFDAISEDLEAELMDAELVLFRARRAGALSVDLKTAQVVEKMPAPTNYRRAQAQRILTETELLREEVSLLEAKLLRHEIKEGVFERLVKQKESLLIKKEKELMDVVARAHEPLPPSAPAKEKKATP